MYQSGNSATAGSFPSGTGFVRVNSGVPEDPATPLSANDIPAFWVATTTRSTNAFSGSLPTTPTLTAGLTIKWQVPSAPSGAATYNLNSLGAKNIYVRGSANAAADLPANRIVTMMYDGTQWQVLSFYDIQRGDLPAVVRLEAQTSSGQSTINGYQTLNFDAASVNTGPAWSYSSGVFTCLIAGTYDYSLSLFANNAANSSLFAKLNNTTLIGSGAATPLYNAPHLCDSYTFAAGDTVRFQIQCGTGSISIDVSIASYRELRITRKPTA